MDRRAWSQAVWFIYDLTWPDRVVTTHRPNWWPR